MGEFVHLHLHSEYSLLDGACRIEDIPRAAKAAGHDAVAITDHGVMYGAVKFFTACKNEGIKPIIGCEVYVAPGSRFERTRVGERAYHHLVLLVQNEVGYKNLTYMVSRSFTEGFYGKPRIDTELLRSHSEGLVALSGCLAGRISQLILADNLRGADEAALELDEIFKGRFYLELQNHGVDGQDKVNAALIDMHTRLGIPLVATNDVHYIDRSDADTQAILLCIQMNKTVSDGRQLGFEKDEYYYKSTDEMKTFFGKYEGAIVNTVKIAESCNYEFETGKVFLPAFTPPNGETPKKYLRRLVDEGFERRVAAGEITFDGKYTRDDYKYRIEYELVVINSMGYDEYFLIVGDFVNYAKSHDIPTGPGRGSGAGSLVAYLVGITEVDPIKYQLLFESFLNPERISMPDFDIDFCYDRRDEVLRYVINKYGEDHVCQIITFGTMASRAAVRDVGRALGMDYSSVDAVAKNIPYKATLKEALELPEIRRMYDDSASVRKLIDVSSSIEGMPRHASTHAAGVVITDKPLYNYLPISTNGDVVVTQYDMDTVAKLGLLKFDFLALRYLTIIDNTCKLASECGERLTPRDIPLDDAETYKLIASGRTDGLFQLESGGMKQLLIKFKPQRIEDIMIAIALYRPGPMDSIPRFLDNRKNAESIKYPLPQLREILEETSGCIVYQEQVMQIFRAIAGYSYGKADVVRRAISKKKAGVIEQERENFISGAEKSGMSTSDAESMFEQITAFSNYGFKKSHAAAYAILSYQTAYLKTHYTGMYYAALITSVLGRTDKMCEYINEAGKLGIKTLAPDINRSRADFYYSDEGIRFGLLAIKNVGRLFVENVIKERERGGDYRSLNDFLNRISLLDTNRKQIESLICSGAMDGLEKSRRSMLEAYDGIIQSLSSKNRGNISGQLDMFSSSEEHFAIPDVGEFSLRERLKLEKDSLGTYFSGHPLDEYSSSVRALEHTCVRDALVGGPKKQVTVCGIILARSDKNTRGGDKMAFCTLEDTTGECELIVFPRALAEYGYMLRVDSAVAVYGEVTQRDDEAPRIIANKVVPLVNDATYIKENGSRTEARRIDAAAPGRAQSLDGMEDGYPAQQTDAVHNGAQRNGSGGYHRTDAQSSSGTASGSADSDTRDGAPHGDGARQSGGAVSSNSRGGAKTAARNNSTTAHDTRGRVLYLRLPDTEGRLFSRTVSLIKIFEGEVDVVLYDQSSKKYIKSAQLKVSPTDFVLNELRALIGEENVILK